MGKSLEKVQVHGYDESLGYTPETQHCSSTLLQHKIF